MIRLRLVLLALLAGIFAFGAAPASVSWPAYEEQAVRLFQEYLRVDTSNPPGNELRAAQFFQQVLEREGIQGQILEFTPGRANFYARLKGSGARKPLLLLNHTDVVTADPARWRTPPFSGAILDGEIYGRGALDMKGEAIAQLMMMIVAHREKLPLARDLVFLATADEEVNDIGSAWMIQNRRDLLDAEYVLTEGGDNLLENGRVKFFGIDVAEKSPFWLRLTAYGTPGHGSRPIADSAPNRLVRALNRVLDWQTEIRVLPSVQKFFADLAPYEPPERARKFRDLREAIKDRDFLASLTRDPAYNYMLRNTVSLTMLRGSPQTNVIPGSASANLDVRLLPGEDAERFLKEITRVVNDPEVRIERSGNYRRPNSSPDDTELFGLFRETLAADFPGVPVTTRMLSGYTECQMYRELGMNCYGFSPFLTTREDSATVHGDNERVSVKNVHEGIKRYWNVVSRLVM